MDYKVLVKLYIPELEQEYELYLPVNRNIKQIKVNLNRMVSDRTEGIYPIINSLELYNRRTGTIYFNKDLLRNTDIRNGTELILF